jgi:hypothetical protein
MATTIMSGNTPFMESLREQGHLKIADDVGVCHDSQSPKEYI